MQNQKEALKDQKKIQFVKEVKGMYGKQFYFYQEPDRSVIALTPEEVKSYKKKKQNNPQKNEIKANFAQLKLSNEPIKLSKLQIRILQRMKDQDDKKSVRSYFQNESILSQKCKKCQQKTKQIQRFKMYIQEQEKQKQEIEAAQKQKLKALKLQLITKKQSSQSERSLISQTENSMILKNYEFNPCFKRSKSHSQIIQMDQFQYAQLSKSYIAKSENEQYD